MAKTYLDIQRITGLSLSTISKYFNGGKLREKNRLAIEKAIKVLDYRVNPIAQSLKSRRSRKVGVLIPELTSTFHTTIMSDVCSILRREGYDTVVCDCHLNKEEEREVLSFLLDKMVDGIITIPLDKTGQHLYAAIERNVPVVLIDRLTSEFAADAVIVDNHGAGAMAAKELLAHGHSRIGLVSGLSEVYTMRGRTKGFVATLKEAGITQPPELVEQIDFTINGGYEATTRLLQLKERPTALFCANYELTLGMIIAVNEFGLRVGEDISVVGFDNLTLSRVIRPRMTMVVQPMQQIAESASKQLIERLEGPEKPGTHIITLPAKIVPEESVKDV